MLRAVALVALLSSCRSPTSVTLVLSSDVACADAPSTSVAVSRADAETLSPSLVTQVCQPDGTIGTVVVVPAADRDENLRVRVVTSISGATCEAPGYGQGCIVSRRQLRFLAHEELRVPIAQQVDCAGVACEATTTCRKGTCVEAQVDQDRCEANPGECGIEIVPEPAPSAGGAGGAGGLSGSSGQGGLAGVAGVAGAAGPGGTGGLAGGSGAAGDPGGTSGGPGGSGAAGVGGPGGEAGSGVGAGAGGQSGASGQAGAGAGGSDAGMSGAGGASGSGGSTGVIRPPLPPLPAGAGTGTTYYVSPGGDDGNDGKSQATPWKSLDKVMASTFGPGDSVLLEGGAPFVGCLTFIGGNVQSTPGAPFTLGAYGGKPFELTASCSGARRAAIDLAGVDGAVVTDGVIRGNQGGAMYGVRLGQDPGAVMHGLRVQNCDISGFYSSTTSDVGGEIFLDGFPGGLDDAKILNNVLHGQDGPTSKDDNGIAGLGITKKVTNLLIQGNVVHDIGGKADDLAEATGSGITVSGVDGAVVQYNVVHHGGGNATTCGGPTGILGYQSSHVTIQYNEVYAMGPAGTLPAGACGWSGHGLVAGVTDSLVQYNYAHDNRGPGFYGHVSGTWSTNVYRHNISQNDESGLLISGDSSVADLTIHNNTLFSSGAALPMQFIPAAGVSFAGYVASNLLIGSSYVSAVKATATPPSGLDGLVFRANDYQAGGAIAYWNGTLYKTLADWSTATGQEFQNGAIVGFTVDPMLTSPGGGATYGGYDPGGLTAYRLLPGSPVRGAGLDLKAASGIDPGASDYFGAPIPHTTGTGFNIGADGAP